MNDDKDLPKDKPAGQVIPFRSNNIKGKMKKLDFALALSNVISCADKPLSHRWKEFGHKFHVAEDTAGHQIYLKEESDGQLRFVSGEMILNNLISYFKRHCTHTHATDVKPADFKYAMQLWASDVRPIDLDTVAPVLQKSTPGICFHRLPFDLSMGEFPTWQEMFNRTSNGTALKLWIGSLFFQQSDMQTYVWIYGEGEDGKGSLARALMRALGDYHSASEQVPTRENRFWTSGLLGKRLVVFPDCNNYGFPQTGLFKSLTGGDRQRIERKNEQPFTTTLKAKYLFLSNEKPSLSGQQSDRRRAIYCELKRPTVNFGRGYEGFLWDEMPYFLFHCVKLYLAACPNHEKIPVDESVIDTLVSDNEEFYEYLYERRFESTPIENRQEWLKAEKNNRPHVTANRFVDIMRQEKLSEFDKRRFKAWLIRCHKVEFDEVVKLNNKSTRAIFWLKEKDVPETFLI